MIKMFTGLPGCGKTYRAVYELKKECSKYFILHNIDGLDESKFEDGKYIQSYPTDEVEFKKFFSVDNQTKLQKESEDKYNRPILVIIDECQQYLDKVDRGVKQWLSYHRHLGQDVWLITQDKFNVAREYNNLVEIEIQGKRGYVFSSFIYSFFSKGERVKTDKIPKDIEIFQLYKSRSMDETKKPKSKLILWAAIMGGLALIVGIYYVGFGLPGIFKKNKEAINKEKPKLSRENYQEKIEIKPLDYKYIGMIKGNPYFIDNSGNIWDSNDIYDGITVISNKERVKGVFINKQSGSIPLKLGSIPSIQGGAGGAGRAPASATKTDPFNAGTINNTFSKVVINIR